MADDLRVQELLDELFESRRTPEQVCVACPELLPAVRERWRRICLVEADLNGMFPPDAEPGNTVSASTAGDTALPHIPGFELEAVLGRGGMGIVFRARQLRLERVVALKMVLAGAYAGPQERLRLKREAIAVARLRHPNVVQIHDSGDADGRAYFTMEYVDGGSLAQRLAGKPQPARQAATLVATLAEAVQAAHDCGIIHRDLKPANVLLTADGTPKITDFGLARQVDGETALTRTGLVLGTPSYMAPEQAAGNTRSLGPAVDIYALGAILYEMLTGRPPFCAESAAATIQQLLAQEPVPPSRLNASIPRDLDTICLHCLHKEPARRYTTAAGLADDLQRFLRGEAIAARSEGRLARLRRRVRRRPGLSAALTASALLSLLLVVGGAWTLSERAAAERAAQADVAATERAAEDDLNEMALALQQSAWSAAGAALDRAKVRLGNRASSNLSAQLEAGERALALVRRLERIRLERALDSRGWCGHYVEAFRNAGLCAPGDEPAVVAERIRASNLRQGLLAALDDWALCAAYRNNPEHERWLLAVSRLADPDPDGWRDRFRAAEVRQNKALLTALADAAPIDTAPVNLLVALGELLHMRQGEPTPFLLKVQRRHPNDLWVNFLLAHCADNPKDAQRYYQAALAIRPETPSLNFNLGYAALWDSRADDAVFYFGEAVRLDPHSATYRAGLGRALLEVGRDRAGREELEQARALNPSPAVLGHIQGALRISLVRQRRWEEACVAWRQSLDADPPGHGDWYGYAELCLYLGREEDYRIARQELLAKFATVTDPHIAERTSRAALLMPAAGKELRQAVTLAGRAAALTRAQAPGPYPYFQFALALAEYRQGHFDQAIAILRGAAAKVAGPAPRLVLAMALQRTNQPDAARQTLAQAISSHDWQESKITDQDGWIAHALRREAESLILPNVPAIPAGK